VLLGGGHSHAIALRLFAMNPIPGVRLTLVSDVTHTPYSGMLPGHIAGFYSYDETHIDLRRLAEFAGAQFLHARATGLDLKQQRLRFGDRPALGFDLLSLDIGSTPATATVPGAAEHAIAIKPVPHLLQHWEHLLAEVSARPDRPWRLAIVGGGAGGVEFALNAHRRLQDLLQAAGQPRSHLEMHLFHRGRTLLGSHNRWVSRHLQHLLDRRGIGVHLAETVTEVRPGKVRCASELTVACDRVFWVTQAAAPNWIADSGLATDARGFVLVGDTLQSLSHAQVFAAGDIATMQHAPRPKAGVFAVRQGKPLFENLTRRLREDPLKPYAPQRRYLSLIGTADKRAIATWGPLWARSTWFWRWKDRIDRAFMARFEQLPTMMVEPGADRNTTEMYCAGCASKVGSSVLRRVLERLETVERADVLVGLGSPDDAAVVRVPPDRLMVHTIDYFRSLISDPHLFGQIAANHCLSDLYAMGATPQSALAVAAVPHATPAKVEETLYQLLSGATRVLHAHQTTLVGGHTTEGDELSFGLSCNGLVPADSLLRKGEVRSGQVAILTKPLGTGALFAAHMRGRAKGRWLDAAIAVMLQSNREAAQILQAHGVTALTDVTGFGLLGHLWEMLRERDIGVEIALAAVPLLPGACEVVAEGIVSSLQPQNLQVARHIDRFHRLRRSPQLQLLCDPQTAGGLLGTLPADRAEACLQALHRAGYERATAVATLHPLAVDKPAIAITPD